MKKRGRLRIGCSGWNYKHWRGRFYPEPMSSKKWLEYYSGFFDTVELNNTFYRLPSPSVFREWQAQAPRSFLFSVKVNRFLTHMKKLKNARAPLSKFLSRARLLKNHLGPLLYQLPPRWHLNLERLEDFLKLLPSDLQHVFEFRDSSWLNEQVFELLKKYHASLCLHDMPGLEQMPRGIGPIGYVRFHGAAKKYQGGYPDATLRRWWHWMEKELRAGRDIYAYFNNDAEAHAVHDAQRLKELGHLKRPPAA
jgi:uncharacterized protein YecE (DUF72 family)